MAAPAPTATCRPTASSSRRPASRRGFSSSSGGGGGIRTPTIRCSGRSTRMTSGPTATAPATSAIFARTASSGSPSRCRPTSGSSIRRPISRRRRRKWTCGGACPRSTTSPSPDRTTASCGRADRTSAAATSWTRRFGTLQEQALAALTNHAQIQSAPPQRLLDDLSSFQRVLFTNERVRALSDAVRQGTLPLPDPDRRLNALEQQGKAVFERACGQCHGGPGQSTPQATPNDPPAPVIRFHNIFSQCPRPVDPTGALRVRGVSATTRAQRAHLRDRVVGGDTGPWRDHPSARGHRSPHVVRSRPRAPDRVRWRGRAQGRLGEVRRARAPGHQQDRAVLHQQQRRHARRDGRSLRRAVQARGGELRPGPSAVVPPIATTDGVNFDRRPAPEERAALLAYLRKL